MIIHSTLTNRAEEVLPVTYHDVDSEKVFEDLSVHAVHAYCFYEDKLVLVYSEEKNYWSVPGGGVEAGESVEEAVVREVHEETNMRVLAQKIIGYQEIVEAAGTKRQTRSVCIVEPYGPFLADPDGDVTEIALIEPKDAKEYFDWKEIGDHVLGRAIEFKSSLSTH